MLTTEQVHVGVTHNVLAVALQFAEVPVPLSEDIVRFLLKSQHEALRSKIIQRQEVVEYDLLKLIMEGSVSDRLALARSPCTLPDSIILDGVHDDTVEVSAAFVQRFDYTPTPKEVQEGLLHKKLIMQKAWEFKARQEYNRVIDLVGSEEDYTDFL